MRGHSYTQPVLSHVLCWYILIFHCQLGSLNNLLLPFMLIRSQNIKKKGEEEEEKASFDGVVKTRNGTTSKTDRLMVSYKNIGSMAT